MLDGFKINFNEISSYLWIAIIAAIFSVFSIKYNTQYIFFGFITFVYGVLGHTEMKTFDYIFDDYLKEYKKTRIIIRIILETSMLVAWFILLQRYVSK